MPLIQQPVSLNAHTHTDTYTHMHRTVLTSEALVMHQTLPTATSE